MSEMIPVDWISVKLKDISVLTKGLTYTSDDYSDKKNGVAFLTLKSISKNGGYSPVGMKFYKGEFREYHTLKIGDILFANTDLTRDGDVIGNPLFFDGFGIDRITLYSMDLSKLAVNLEKAHSKFLYYLLMTHRVKRYMVNSSAGSTVLHLDTNRVKELKLNLPPLPEQKKIASILSSVDEVIETNQKKIKKLQDLKKAIMNELLTKGIGHKEFKDSELGRIPNRWEVYELGKLCNFTQGVQISLDETLRVKKDGYIRYLYINDFLLDKNLRFIKDEFPKKIVTEQDLIMANTGHSAGTVFRGKHGVLSNNAFKISIKKLIKSEYLFYYLSTDNYWFKIRKLFNSAGQPHVGHSNIAKLQFLCPPLDEQDKILSIFHKIDENILNNEKKLSKIKFLKKSLMQDLLTGKIRVKVN